MKFCFLTLFLIAITSVSLKAETQVRVSVVVDGKVIGEVESRFEPPSQNFKVEKKESGRIFGVILKDHKWARLEKANEQNDYVSLHELERIDIKCQFNENQLELTCLIPLEARLVQDLSLSYRPFLGMEVGADPWSGYLNFNVLKGLKETTAATGSGLEPLEAQTEFVQHLGPATLEGIAFYKEHEARPWERGDVSLVTDLEPMQTRIRLGDSAPNAVGYMSGLSAGGIHISRQFSIDPSRPSSASRSTLLQIQKPSMLEVTVNQVLIARIRVPVGPFNLRDIPLLVGKNKVHVKLTDDFGAVEEFDVDLFFDGALLGQGIHDFSYFLGRPWISNGRQRDYEKNGFVSLSHRYGLTDRTTLGFNGQSFDNQNMLGLEVDFLFPIGSIQSDVARSQTGNSFGLAERFRFRSNDQEEGVMRRHRFFLEYEHRNSNFSPLALGVPSTSDTSTRIEGLLQNQINSQTTLFYGGGYQWEQNGGEDAKLYKAALQMGFSKNMRADVSFSKTIRTQSDEQWLLNFTWIESSNLYSSSVLSDSLSRQTTINLHKNKEHVNDDFTGDMTFQDGQNSNQLDLRGDYFTPRAEFFLRHQRTTVPSQRTELTQLGLGSALAWSHGRFSFSRPIHDSFALLAAQDIPEGSELLINPNRDHSEAEIKSWNSVVLPNLTSYQSSSLQIDSTKLPVGYSLPREAFRLKPEYRSGVFVDLGLTRKVLVRGRLVQRSSMPIAFISGQIWNANQQLVTDAFFTDDQGNFVLDQLLPGSYTLKLRELGWKVIELKISESPLGEIQLGDLKVEREDGA